MIAAMIDWTNVLVTVIVGLPAMIGAVASLRVHSQIKTPSKTSIGAQVENALQTALANHYRLRALAGDGMPPTPAEVRAEDARAEEITGQTRNPSTKEGAA